MGYSPPNVSIGRLADFVDWRDTREDAVDAYRVLLLGGPGR